VDKNMLESETVEYVIQINGKKRSIINSKKDIDEKTLIEKIKKDQKIVKFLDGSNIIRSIFVKNKLINLIIK
jgi:leucyl-tRNA synthetase